MSAADGTILIELNPQERRLYDRLRASVFRPRFAGPSRVSDLLLLLPDLTVLLFRLMRDARVSVGDKAIALLALSYVLSPLDILPGILLGPVGLVDDLFVVGTALSRLINHVHPDVVRSHWPGQGDALEAIQRVTVWIETRVVERVRGTIDWLIGRPGLRS